MATQTLNSNDIYYRLLKVSYYIGTYGDKVAREFLNGNECAKADLRNLALIITLFKAAKEYKTNSNVFLLENSTEDSIILESGDCLLMEL